jgi:hypothetical protein
VISVFSSDQTRFKDFEALFIEHDPEPEISFEEADLLSVLADVRRGTA